MDQVLAEIVKYSSTTVIGALVGLAVWLFQKGVVRKMLDSSATNTTAIKSIQQIAEANASKMDNVTTELNMVKSQIVASTNKMELVSERLTQAITELKAEIGRVRDEMKTMWKNIDKNKARYRQLHKQMSDLKTQLQYFEGVLDATTSGKPPIGKAIRGEESKI